MMLMNLNIEDQLKVKDEQLSIGVLSNARCRLSKHNIEQ